MGDTQCEIMMRFKDVLGCGARDEGKTGGENGSLVFMWACASACFTSEQKKKKIRR